MAPHPLPMLRNVLSLLSFALLLASVPAGALPMLDLDLDPDASGVQSTRTAAVGSEVRFRVEISGLEASAPLQELDVSLFFDPAALDPGFLSDGVGLRHVDSDPSGPGEIRTHAVVLGPGRTGTQLVGGPFELLAPGTTLLSVIGVLEDPEGDPIAFGGTLEGQITAVPEPAAAVLVGLAGLAGPVLLRRARRD